MIVLELTEHEAELLHEIAEEWLSDLRMEISATDLTEFRESLKRKEVVLRGLLERLPALVG